MYNFSFYFERRNTNMIYWKEEYRIGVDLIDEQHKKLFQIAADIYDLLKNNLYIDKYNRVVALLSELRDYTIFHFKTEEAYQQEIGYKRYLSHKVEHDDFVNKINNIDLDSIDENQDLYILELLEFVVKWIGEHILEKDKQIVAG
jgi:hemerythrin